MTRRSSTRRTTAPDSEEARRWRPDPSITGLSVARSPPPAARHRTREPGFTSDDLVALDAGRPPNPSRDFSLGGML